MVQALEPGGTREENRNKTSRNFSIGQNKPESGQENYVRHLCPNVRHCLTTSPKFSAIWQVLLTYLPKLQEFAHDLYVLTMFFS